MSKLIYDPKHLQEFVNEVLPNLTSDEVYFLSFSARNKYLNKEERELYHLGRTEMFNRMLIRSKDLFLNRLERFQFDETNHLYGFTTKNGKRMPLKALVVYLNINPSSGLEAFQNFSKTVQNKLFELQKKMLHGHSFNEEEMSWFAKLDTKLLNEYQKSRSNKYFVDIDIDSKNSKAWFYITNELDSQDVEHYTIQTRNGWHVMLKTETIKFNYPDLINRAHQFIEEEDEIIINTNAMIPMPGTLAAEFPVRWIK